MGSETILRRLRIFVGWVEAMPYPQQTLLLGWVSFLKRQSRLARETKSAALLTQPTHFYFLGKTCAVLGSEGLSKNKVRTYALTKRTNCVYLSFLGCCLPSHRPAAAHSDRIPRQQPRNEAGQDFELNKPSIHMIVNVSSA
ncbi:MAG: hypothetical protein DSM106950_32365 [Stigonema ocellatum SAG 48.90 = DSM 106950]|nr:hypothetical protein [Stigonema ocellatum SAG 48.90 = DSM 106950]